MDITCYSSFSKLLAISAYVIRYVQNSCKQQLRLSEPWTATEHHAAMKHWISSAQLSSFPAEIAYLQNKQQLCPNPAKQLLFLDKDNLIRYHGRIYNAPVSDSTKFPLLLLPKHPLTTLIIQDIYTQEASPRWNSNHYDSNSTGILDPHY